MQEAEGAEKTLSYLSSCNSEAARKRLGSYYTPADVALYFWTEFFSLNGLEEGFRIKKFWGQHHFVEPAAGAGALVFALLKKGGEMGLELHHLEDTNLTIIDINQAALDFVSNKLNLLSAQWGFAFRNIHYICRDFRDCTLPDSPRAPLFFGNPPFVTNPKGSRWKNIFADFLERALCLSGPKGLCHFILPVSIAFSRDYVHLREQICATGKSVALSSFDNIPDTLFPSGKPEHTNTNKANSQRCSILTVFPSDKPCALSTKMHRWKRNERASLLASRPVYQDISEYNFDNQFPRPENVAVLRYLNETVDSPRFHTLLSNSGPYSLFVASVARNFIGLRENSNSGAHQLRFDTKEKFYFALLILSSDIFMDYWRTVGDGFHVTRTNLLDFPLHRKLMKNVSDKVTKGRYLWEKRAKYAKTKRHPNGITLSYDFRTSALCLIENF